MSVDFEALRTHLPLSDPDRHALDVEADTRFAQLAPGWTPLVPGVYPDTSSPANYQASVDAEYVTPVVWDDTPDCEPAFETPRPVQDVQTGGRL